jgi:hypothetical protein
MKFTLTEPAATNVAWQERLNHQQTGLAEVETNAAPPKVYKVQRMTRLAWMYDMRGHRFFFFWRFFKSIKQMLQTITRKFDIKPVKPAENLTQAFSPTPCINSAR